MAKALRSAEDRLRILTQAAEADALSSLEAPRRPVAVPVGAPKIWLAVLTTRLSLIPSDRRGRCELFALAFENEAARSRFDLAAWKSLASDIFEAAAKTMARKELGRESFVSFIRSKPGSSSAAFNPPLDVLVPGFGFKYHRRSERLAVILSDRRRVLRRKRQAPPASIAHSGYLQALWHAGVGADRIAQERKSLSWIGDWGQTFLALNSAAEAMGAVGFFRVPRFFAEREPFSDAAAIGTYLSASEDLLEAAWNFCACVESLPAVKTLAPSL